jgi:methylphosphotriester-DNA--protein-cysteine methyltransferase
MIVRMSIDFTECDRVRLARDAAYDGLFYTGAHTTGICDRPSPSYGPVRRRPGKLRANQEKPR